MMLPIINHHIIIIVSVHLCYRASRMSESEQETGKADERQPNKMRLSFASTRNKEYFRAYCTG